MGAWIETVDIKHYDVLINVAPFMGAWIETLYKELTRKTINCCSLYGSMD